MKKLLILADSPNWCFGRRARAIQEYEPPGWATRIEYFGLQEITQLPYELADVVFLLDPKKTKIVRQHFQNFDIRIPLVAAHNSGPGRPGYGIDETLTAADYVIVNNHAAWAAARYGQREYRACNISNGVDLRVFRNEIPWLDRPNRALWIGSASKSEDTDDVKRFSSVLSPLQRILEPATGIIPDFRVASPDAALDDDGMREFYNSGRYLICPSKTEGTPNIALEAAACGCAVITTPVGNMPELIIDGRNGKIVHQAWANTVGFLDALQYTPAEQFEAMAGAMAETIKGWDWSKRTPWYFAVFDKLITGRVPRSFTYLNCPPANVGV